MSNKFLVILLFPLLCASVAICGTCFMPTQWQISAQIAPPKMNELGNYFSLSSTYRLVSDDANAADINKLEQTISQNAYLQFLKNLNAIEKRVIFFEQSDYLKKQANIEKIALKEIAQQRAAQFTIKQNQLRFSSFDLETLDVLFIGYLREINQQTRNALNEEIITKWRALFQQVKNAADAKLNVSWENKLKIMQSVQPLDNNLVAFHFEQAPKITALPKPYLLLGCSGAILGLLLSFLAILILNGKRKK